MDAGPCLSFAANQLFLDPIAKTLSNNKTKPPDNRMKLSQTIGLVAIALLLANIQLAAQTPDQPSTQGAQPARFAIAIHGGAGSSPKIFTDAQNDRRRASMKQALQIGTDILKNGGSSMDAVEQVIRFLEDDPQFNAGVGAVFNAVGSHELDASIMYGKDLSCGAVAGVSIVKNPISLARKVLTDTPHVLLAGPRSRKVRQTTESTTGLAYSF